MHITVTADSLNYISPGQILYFTDDSGVPCQVIVVSNVGPVLTVRTLVGVGTGAVAAASVNLTNGMHAGGDGFQTFSNPVRTKTVRRTNLIEKVDGDTVFVRINDAMAEAEPMAEGC